MPLVAPYNSIQATKISPSDASPRRDDIAFVKGNQVDLRYMWQNVVWTDTRPTDAYDLPMYSAAEVTAGLPATDGLTVEDVSLVGTTPSADWSGTRLIADWQERYWAAELRNGYIATYRMYNGWVPWYGRRPQWQWWNRTSLKGVFEVNATYDLDLQATVTHAILPSLSSNRIYPSDTYMWDLVVASAATYDETQNPPVPLTFTGLRTMVSGKALVEQNWTQGVPLS